MLWFFRSLESYLLPPAHLNTASTTAHPLLFTTAPAFGVVENPTS